MNKIELLDLWRRYKEVRKRINLPIDQNNEQTVVSFIEYASTEPKSADKSSK